MGKVAYIETSVPSAHESHRTDPGSRYRRKVTREWWEQEARQYELVTSDVTLIERLGLLTPVILSPELLWNEDAT